MNLVESKSKTETSQKKDKLLSNPWIEKNLS
jgi:hypothetical protein